MTTTFEIFLLKSENHTHNYAQTAKPR